MGAFLSNGLVQILIALLTLVGGYIVAKINRKGSEEANQTTGWTNLVTSLQRRNDELEKRLDAEELQVRNMFGVLDVANRDLSGRVVRLENSRRAWKWWGQRVVPLLRQCNIAVPDPPESLDDTDPNLTTGVD